MIRLIFILGTFLSLFSVKSSDLDSLISVLDDEIKKKSNYEKIKRDRIESILIFLNKPNLDLVRRFRYNNLLISEYEKYSYDSTIFYTEENLKIANELGDQVLINETLISLGGSLSNVGRRKEAFDILLKVDSSSLDKEQQIRFNNINRKLFEDLNYYASTSNSNRFYRSRYNHHRNKLLKLLDKDHDIYLDILEKDLLDQWLPDEALHVNQQRLERTILGSPRYSLITFQRAIVYGAMGNNQEQKIYLILSAISDIQAVVKDNASLTILASILYNEGDIEKAYFYIQSAFDDAMKFNSTLRFEEISRTLSPITRSYQQLSDLQKRKLELNVMVIGALSLVLMITIFLIYRQVSRLSIARNDLSKSLKELNVTNERLKMASQKQELLNKDLSESNLVKEHYIANFLNIQSEYIDKIDTYQKLVKRMLTGRKFDQLIDQINSGQFVDAEIKSFYKTFDEAFLSIHPGFVSQFNELLKEGEAIELAEGEILNTELRIFALIRLGVSDSSTIARVLRYSVNTIYNYRVKIKNKARGDREDFEKMVQKINAF